MASGPDLFVVCKNCGSEVSPYITECPYCGTRLRKRAPKLEKGGVPKPPKPRRRPPTPSLGKLRPGEIPGIRADSTRKPFVTIFLVVAAALFTLGARAGIYSPLDAALATPFDGEYWKLVTTTFYYDSTGYELVTLGTVGLFGWLLERRHGFLVPLLVYALGAAAGTALEIWATPNDADFALGANSAALALLAAWSVPELLARRRGEDTDGDLLGVAAFTVVLLATPIATAQASAEAGVGGALVGLLLGLPLAKTVRD